MLISATEYAVYFVIFQDKAEQDTKTAAGVWCGAIKAQFVKGNRIHVVRKASFCNAQKGGCL